MTLKEFRLEKGLTHRDMSLILGCTIGTYSNWENKRHSISPAYREKFKTIFKEDPANLGCLIARKNK